MVFAEITEEEEEDEDDDEEEESHDALGELPPPAVSQRARVSIAEKADDAEEEYLSRKRAEEEKRQALEEKERQERQEQEEQEREKARQQEEEEEELAKASALVKKEVGIEKKEQETEQDKDKDKAKEDQQGVSDADAPRSIKDQRRRSSAEQAARLFQLARQEAKATEPELPPGVAQKRRDREHEWTKTKTIADELVSKYVEYGFLDEHRWLARLSEKLSNVLATNVELQEQLRNQDIVLAGLEQEYAERTVEWGRIEVEMTKSKVAAQSMTDDTLDAQRNRVRSERALWEKEVLLRERLSQLNKERTRLIDQRRNEDRQMEKLREVSTRLGQELLTLELRKAELENDSSEYDRQSSMQDDDGMSEEGLSGSGPRATAGPSTMSINIPRVPPPAKQARSSRRFGH